ncbi:MAG: GatB/YqeY domain-containing protein [Deltaproteobacteria bacterium]|nr:GatB/YqeY domain-containing protein [Deltaproteobacteria bacterium]
MTNTGAENYGWNKDMQMPLIKKLKEDLKKAMLGKDNQVRDTIRIIMGEYPSLTVPIELESGKKTTRVKKPEEITNDDLLGIIRKLVKSEKTVLELQQKDSSDYLTILETYLPKMATKEEIIAWINENIDFSEYKNSMQAMGTIMKHFGKLADGNLVKQLLQGLDK